MNFEIIKNYLRDTESDGLWNSEGECACSIGDLEPCGEFDFDNCHAGYIQVEKRDGDFAIGSYRPGPCPNCKTKRDIGPGSKFKKACPNCGSE